MKEKVFAEFLNYLSQMQPLSIVIENDKVIITSGSEKSSDLSLLADGFDNSLSFHKMNNTGDHTCPHRLRYCV